mgnify:CR=1 FL=1
MNTDLFETLKVPMKLIIRSINSLNKVSYKYVIVCYKKLLFVQCNHNL